MCVCVCVCVSHYLCCDLRTWCKDTVRHIVTWLSSPRISRITFKFGFGSFSRMFIFTSIYRYSTLSLSPRGSRSNKLLPSPHFSTERRRDADRCKNTTWEDARTLWAETTHAATAAAANRACNYPRQSDPVHCTALYCLKENMKINIRNEGFLFRRAFEILNRRVCALMKENCNGTTACGKFRFKTSIWRNQIPQNHQSLGWIV